MVSTDDEEIAMTAEKYGATVPFLRSAGNSDHFATLADVLDEVIGKYRNKGTDFKHLCCILPTAALISVANLKKGYDLLNSMKYYSVRPVVRFSYPIQRALFMEDGMVDYVYPEHARTRSQDLDPAYHDAGQFYWLFFNKGFDPSKKGAFEISEYEAHDIDTWEDLKIAEYKYSYLKKQRTTRD
jgi:N-acylneuraminate cytidylyltransferase